MAKETESIITIDMGFGDAGKGSWIQYISTVSGIRYHEKYNGGCQGRHCIIADSRKYVFSQLSPSILNGKTTILSRNFVFEPFALTNELDAVSKISGISIEDLKNRLFIDAGCICATPIHKMFNHAEEDGDFGRGSVGTGISIAGWYSKKFPNASMTAGCIQDKNKMHEIMKLQKKLFADLCNKSKYSDQIENFDIEAYIAELYNEMMKYMHHVVDTEHAFHRNIQNKFVYEGSQGFMLDCNYGLYPNTTLLDTSTDSLINQDGRRIGLIRAVYTRHGKGCFPTESEYLNNVLSDESQEIGKYSGKIRFGYFDCVLFRYAVKFTHINEIYMSHMDYLRIVKKPKICIGYIYKGNKSMNRLSEFFSFTWDGEKYIIHDILKPSRDLTSFLYDCVPVYKDIVFENDCGTMERTMKYIGQIKKLCHIPITAVSYGPNISEKFAIKSEEENSDEWK